MSTRENDWLKLKRVAAALQKNQMESFCAETCEEAVEIVRGLLPKGGVISCGGSVTLYESGVMELMKNGDYTFLDRTAAHSPEAVREIYLKTYDCDVFLMSANAVTERGELYNVDGNGNRISALIHGPKQVIVVAGVNKIVPDLAAAVYRVKTVAAPCNGMRLQTETPCALTGACAAVRGSMTEGCAAPKRMCVHYLTSAFQRDKNRIKVILVNEALGY